jgi:uncharacterized protein YndB with AHSA1/START domain
MTSNRAVAVRLLVLASLAAAPAAAAPEVRNTSYLALDGSRVLQHSIVVPASQREVWDAFTTADGLRAWAVPIVAVDFRLGGIWESSYDLGARIGQPGNIKNRILSFLPPRLLVIQAVAAPPTFPNPELLPEIFTVIELDEIGPQEVAVTISMVGYRSGEGYDAIYRLFAAGNAWSLQKLHQRFTSGPVDWRSVEPSGEHSPRRPGS